MELKVFSVSISVACDMCKWKIPKQNQTKTEPQALSFPADIFLQVPVNMKWEWSDGPTQASVGCIKV